MRGDQGREMALDEGRGVEEGHHFFLDISPRLKISLHFFQVPSLAGAVDVDEISGEKHRFFLLCFEGNLENFRGDCTMGSSQEMVPVSTQRSSGEGDDASSSSERNGRSSAPLMLDLIPPPEGRSALWPT
jgi:hypothetical protein